MIFRQLFDPQSSTYTYLLADPASREALLIDPVFEQARRDAALIDELGLKLAWTLETHVHADHVTGAWLLREKLGSRIAALAPSGAEGADRYLEPGETLAFGKRASRRARPRATPAAARPTCSTTARWRSPATRSSSAAAAAPTSRAAMRAALPQRARADLLAARPLPALPRPRLPRPHGHERRRGEALQPAPRRVDRRGRLRRLHDAPRPAASQADGRRGAGEPEVRKAADHHFADPDWAPLTYTFAGIWEVQPHWLEEHLRDVQIVDVREPEEFNGPLGHVPGAMLIPLGTLQKALLGEGPARRGGLPLGRALGAGHAACSARRASTRSRTSPAACCAGARSASRSRAAATMGNALKVRTRFAPSPTGYLHIGGRAHRALLLGVRAPPRRRVRAAHRGHRPRALDEESVDAILDGLQWLGIDWDEGPFFQMQRLARYKEVAEQLIAAGHAYYDYMSREELEQLRREQLQRGEKPRYDGRWRPERAQGQDAAGDVDAGGALPHAGGRRGRLERPREGPISFRTPSSTTWCCCAPTACRPTTSAWWSTTSTWTSRT